MCVPRDGIRVVSWERRSVERAGWGYDAMGTDEMGCAGRGFEICVYEVRMWCLRRRVRADIWAAASFSDWAFAAVVEGFVRGEEYRVRSTAKKAGYAADKRWIDSFSGVIVGKESRHGLSASWKTESRFVRRRMSHFAAESGDRRVVRIEQPDAL